MENKPEQIYLKIQKLLSFFHRADESFQIHLMPFINKKTSLSDKKTLRQKLIHQIKSHKNYKQKNYNWKELLQIRKKPFFPNISISISYCGYLGIFLLAFDKKISIGFDMEYKERVSSLAAQRISSSQEEFDNSPHPALLWVAKEAGVKSLSAFNRPILFKECILSNWKLAEDREEYFFNFCLNGVYKGKGAAGFLNGFALAYAEKLYCEKI